MAPKREWSTVNFSPLNHSVCFVTYMMKRISLTLMKPSSKAVNVPSLTRENAITGFQYTGTELRFTKLFAIFIQIQYL